MGLALGKDLDEIRQMPYPRFRRWQLFYALEPWGWENEEYLAAAQLAMLYNINRGKGQTKKPADFIRDMEKAIFETLKDDPDFSELPLDERKRALQAQIKKDLGIK